MTLNFYCAMCGADKQVTVKPERTIDVAKVIKASGWIAQQNGDNYDLYCSKRCAS